MNCTEFRGLYSDFVDGLLDELGEITAHRHLSECIPCRRFHGALQWGVRELRSRPQVLPSADFTRRVERAILAETSTLAIATRQGVAAAAVLMGLTVVAAGMFAFDLARHAEPPRSQAAALGPLPVLGPNAFRPTFRYVAHSVAANEPFATARAATAPYGAPLPAEPALLIGYTDTR